MLSSNFTKFFSNESIMKPLQRAAKEAADQFVVEGLKQFFTRWSDQIYDHGMKINDKSELLNFADKMKGEIEFLKHQASIQGTFEIIPFSAKEL